MRVTLTHMDPAQQFTTLEYLPADGREFITYMQVVMKSMNKLRDDKRIPDDAGMDAMLAFWRDMTTAVKTDVNRVPLSSAQPITTTVPMTAGEHRKIWAMFDTLYPLLEILELRGAVDLKRSEGVTRVIDALYSGTLA